MVRNVKIVPQGYAGVIERLGKYHRTAEAGVVVLMPLLEKIRYVSLKEQVDEYKPQPVITADNVTVTIDAILYFQIINSAHSLYEVENYFVALELLTMTTLRDIIGEMTLDECLTSRERINARLGGVLDDATGKWGIKVTRVEIRTIQPHAEIQSAMEKQIKAERDKRDAILEAEGIKQSTILKAEGEKRARVLEAEGEKEAAILRAEGKAQAYRNLFGSLKVIGIDDKVIAIRYLEALEKVADGNATKLILPVEASGILGAIAGIAESFKETNT